MTAEIAIFNRTGVALAADSAVTIGPGDKIYNSANKLFSLSKYHPVGVMVYGRADLMDVPWETVIKSYRKSLGDTSFGTLKAYVGHFFEFLKNSQILFPPSQQKRHYVYRIRMRLQSVREEVETRVGDIIEREGEIAESAIGPITSECILKLKDFVEGAPRLENIPNNFSKTNAEKYAKEIGEEISNCFGKLPISDEERKILTDVCALLPEKDILDGTSGVVIAGYGEEEIFPSCETFLVDSIISGVLRCKRIDGKCQQISFENTAAIVPFAQSEIAQTFIEGISPQFLSTISGYVRTILEKYPDRLTQSIADEEQRKALAAILKADVSKIIDSFNKEIGEYKRKTNWGPIVDAVTVLSKDDLAAMAESLVNLTSFKRKVTLGEKETVGGPIDVAVISKGDGLVWIKRKHYFQTELNQHFMRNYFRGTSNDAGEERGKGV